MLGLSKHVKNPDSPKSGFRYFGRDELHGIISAFSGLLLGIDSICGQYHLHNFSKKQPDLKPGKRGACHVDLWHEFLIDKGIGGFLAWMSSIWSVRSQIREIISNGPMLHQSYLAFNQAILAIKDLLTGETSGERQRCCSNPRTLEQYWSSIPTGANQNGTTLRNWMCQIFTKWQRRNALKAEFFGTTTDLPTDCVNFGGWWRLPCQICQALFVYLLHLMGPVVIYQGEEIWDDHSSISPSRM